MNGEWKDRLSRTVRETEDLILRNEKADHEEKIKTLTDALEEKQREIDDLK